MSRIRAFGHFWWDFIVGDDWRVAAGLGIALALTAVLNETFAAWWLLPLAVIAILGESLRRAAAGER
jgi:hypothetical protein